jgi:glyoxylase-like metal-dependent hydrolase (beta-lactamase superfamily II)
MGGLRAFVSEKPIVLTTQGNKDFYEKFAPGLKVETFDKKQIISDGEKTIELINVGANPHTAENIVVYFPKEKYLFQGDLFYFNNEATFPLKDRLPVMFFFAGWLKKNNISPVRVYGFHSTMFATNEHIEKIIGVERKNKKVRGKNEKNF